MMEKNYIITEDLSNEKLIVFQWECYKSWVLLIFLILMGGICLLCKFGIILHILRFAPKNRPINKLVFVDQVRIFYLLYVLY